MTDTAYTHGLHELGDGLFAYVQPDGSYGWSNAGLVAGDGNSLLVDTLFDLRLTQDMLDAMAPVTATKPIETLINTHGDGDHCFGNQLVPANARIHATTAAVATMQELPPAVVTQLLAQEWPPDMAEFLEHSFGSFDFSDVELRLPDETIDERRTLTVGGRALEFIPLGPAHTDGDAIVNVPGTGVVFTGDLLFSRGTPITWHGPLSSWIAACDRILELGATTLVSGHGPVTDTSIIDDVQRYLRYVDKEARARFASGLSFTDAVDDIELGEYAAWPDADRVVANVDAVYRELDPDSPERSRIELLSVMASYRKRHALPR